MANKEQKIDSKLLDELLKDQDPQTVLSSAGLPGDLRKALAYKIGQLKIRELRDGAEQRLGDQFDIKAFHTQVLMDGPMPLSMMEDKIDDCVESQL